MPNVLVVDDSSTDRRVAGYLMTKAGPWKVHYALHGAEAVEKLQQTPIDIVLADLLMPGMSGLELVASVRQHHPQVPVILMTSRGSEGFAALALREGAANYIPKRLLPRKLVETVQRVMAVSRARPPVAAIDTATTERSFSFLLASDIAAVGGPILELQEAALQLGLCDQADCTRLGVALQEAVLNAIYYGNLELRGQSATDEDVDNDRLAATRAAEAPYRDRRVHLDARLSAEEGVFTIRDEGPGFDTSQLPEPGDLSSLEKASGRGILLMRFFMDEVSFDASGREVTLIKRRRFRL